MCDTFKKNILIKCCSGREVRRPGHGPGAGVCGGAGGRGPEEGGPALPGGHGGGRPSSGDLFYQGGKG